VRILFDTSVLIAAVVEAHPAHAVTFPWLQRVKDKVDAGFVAAHSLAEMYSILTRLPVRPPISPEMARQVITVSVLNTCAVVALSVPDYVTLLDHLADLKIVGGAVYDALLLHAASKSEVDQVITLNARDFRRVYPTLADRIVSPLEG
jgi:predicted nucleic acid-binding protein